MITIPSECIGTSVLVHFGWIRLEKLILVGVLDHYKRALFSVRAVYGVSAARSWGGKTPLDGTYAWA